MTPRTWVAGAADADTVATLLLAFRDWWGRDWPPEESFRAGVERLLADERTDFLLGAPEAGAPAAGVCQLRFRHSLWLKADECFLEDLFVREDARRTGLGTALVEAAVARSRDRGCGRVELDVDERNEPALRLYERCGFSASGSRGGRRLLMRLPLDQPPA